MEKLFNSIQLQLSSCNISSITYSQTRYSARSNCIFAVFIGIRPVDNTQEEILDTNEADPFDAPVEGDTVTEEVDDMFDAPAVENIEEDADMFAADPIPEPVPEPEPEKDSAHLVFARSFRAIIEDRDTEERKKRQERIDRADAELVQWRTMRTEHREKTAATNRTLEEEFSAERVSEKESLSSWAQVVKSIDTQATSDDDRTDAARMRSVLIQLKNNPLKPQISAAAN